MTAEGTTEQGPHRPKVGSARVVALVAAVIALFAGLGYMGYRWARSDALAVLTDVLGPSAQRDRKEDIGQWFSAELGDEFSGGDGARTNPDTEAHFQLYSGALLNLKPASQIRFGQRGERGEAVGLTVEVGEVDVRTKERTLTINSQFGEVIIEPNSLIRLRRDGAELMMSVEVGGLTLSKDGDELKRLAAGDALTVAIGGILVDEEKPQQTRRDPAPDQPDRELSKGDGVDHADLIIPAGQSCVVHDPAPPTAVGFDLKGTCDGPARITVGDLQTEALARGNLRLDAGLHKYAVTCLSSPDQIATRGRVQVLRDAGTRKLPSFTPQASVATDGRRYTVLYQSRLPQVTVSWPGAPEADKYFLLVNGQSSVVSSPVSTLASGRLPPGTHKVAFRAVTTPPRQSRTTTVVVKYDAQAPTARLSEPSGGFGVGDSFTISGQALPGWTVSLGGKELELDGRRQFRTDTKSEGTVVVTFEHPERGIHYYLRRPRTPG